MSIKLKKFIVPILLICLTLTIAIRNGDLNKLLRVNESSKTSANIINLMTESPEVLLNANVSFDIAVSTINLVFNKNNKSNKDVLLGSHSVTRKVLIANGKIGFYMDTWEGMSLKTVQGVFAKLEQRYGPSIELPVLNYLKRWNENGNEKSRILKNFEIKNERIHISIQTLEKQSYSQTYTLVASYTK